MNAPNRAAWLQDEKHGKKKATRKIEVHGYTTYSPGWWITIHEYLDYQFRAA